MYTYSARYHVTHYTATPSYVSDEDHFTTPVLGEVLIEPTHCCVVTERKRV